MRIIPLPLIIGEDATGMNKAIFKVEVSEYVKSCNMLQANVEKSYKLVLRQCTELTRMQLEGIPDWGATDDISDVIKLLHQAIDQKYYPLSLYSATKSVYCLQQGPMMTNTQLVDKLKARV